MRRRGRIAAEQSLELAESVGNRRAATVAHNELGEIARLRGDAAMAIEHDDARACFEESLRSLTEQNGHPEGLVTLEAFSRYERHHGDPARGDALLAEAEAIRDRLAAMDGE